MTILITLTTAGTDTGPFTLFSDVDGFTSSFEAGVSKAALLGGYTSVLVPYGTTIIRVVSEGACPNYVDISVLLTTTTTTTLPNPEFSTLTFDNYENGEFTFTLSNPIYSTAVVISDAFVDGYTSGTVCAGDPDTSDTIDLANILGIAAGDTTGTMLGNTPLNSITQSYIKGASIVIQGYGTYVDGDTLTIDGTLVTVVISSVCEVYNCILYFEYAVRYGISADIACINPIITVYTAFGLTISTGTIVYTDSALNVPLTGQSYIVNPVTLEVFNMNSTTGLILSTTGTTC